MKIINRIIGFVSAIALIAALFAGCDITKNSDTDIKAAVEAPADVSQKDVTLTLWQASSDTYQSRLDMQAGFQKEYPHIKLNIVETPLGSNVNYLAAIAAGNAPSCMPTGWPTIAPYVYQNALMPIDDFIAKTPDFANFDQSQVDMFLINGKHYAVPGDKYVMTWTYNKKLFAEAGITAPPATWNEFLADAEKLTVPEKQQYGVGLLATQWGCWHFMVWVWGAGGDLSKRNSDGTLAITFTDPAVIKAAEFYRTLRKEKVVQPDISEDYTALQKDFAMGRSAMFFGANVQQIVSMGGKAEDYGYFVFPRGPSGRAYTQASGDANVITATGDKNVAEAAWTYLMYCNSKKQIEIGLKERALSGTMSTNPILGRIDVNVCDFGILNPEEMSAVEASKLISKPEFYGKGAVSRYADEMVASIFEDTGTDIIKVLQKAQDKAAKDVETFNKGILEGRR